MPLKYWKTSECLDGHIWLLSIDTKLKVVEKFREAMIYWWSKDCFRLIDTEFVVWLTWEVDADYGSVLFV